MNKFLIFISLISLSAFTCEIKVPAKVLVVSESISRIKNFKTNGCNPSQHSKFFNLLESSKGRISLTRLREQLEVKFMSPSPFIEIVHLKDLLKMKISDTEFRRNYSTLKILNDHDAYPLNEDQYVKIDCYNCDKALGNTLNYAVAFQDSTTKKHKMNAQMVQTQSFRVYRAVRDIPVFRSNLSANAFESIVLETEKPKNYFEDMPSINFLKTTRPIKKGEIILKSHFAYKNVIKMGQVVTIELKNKNISLTTHAKAMQTGKINQTIQVKALNSKKIFSAKITEPGKAEVTL